MSLKAWEASANARPTDMPATTDFGTHFEIFPESQDADTSTQKAPVASDAPVRVATVDPGRVAMPAPMAFMGCTGSGARNHQPEITSANPNAKNIPAGFAPGTAKYANMNAMNVQRSAKAAFHSDFPKEFPISSVIFPVFAIREMKRNLGSKNPPGRSGEGF